MTKSPGLVTSLILGELLPELVLKRVAVATLLLYATLVKKSILICKIPTNSYKLTNANFTFCAILYSELELKAANGVNETKNLPFPLS